MRLLSFKAALRSASSRGLCSCASILPRVQYRRRALVAAMLLIVLVGARERPIALFSTPSIARLMALLAPRLSLSALPLYRRASVPPEPRCSLWSICTGLKRPFLLASLVQSR
jgi:hypothetical protein